jgi:hypothetical protein
MNLPELTSQNADPDLSQSHRIMFGMAMALNKKLWECTKGGARDDVPIVNYSYI